MQTTAFSAVTKFQASCWTNACVSLMWEELFQVTCRLLGVILEETTPEELQVGRNASANFAIFY